YPNRWRGNFYRTQVCCPRWVPGSKMSATRETVGAHSFSSCNHFSPTENSKLVKPVMLPFGRARFMTKPAATGSGTIAAVNGTRQACRIAHGGADLVPARGPDRAHAVAPGRTQCPQLAGLRRHGHIRRILPRPHRDQCARRRLAGLSLGDA